MRKHNKSKDECLKILAGGHSDWLNMAASILPTDLTRDLANEIVQKTYDKLYRLDKLHKCVNADDSFSKVYMYATIRSVCYDHFNKVSKERERLLIFDNDAEAEYNDEDTNASNEAQGVILDKVNHYLKTEFTWFDRQIFQLYHDSGMSMQKLSDATTISKTSIYTSIRNINSRLRELLSEDYQDLKNKDYQFIKPLSNE